MPHAQLDQHRVDRSNLNAVLSTSIADFRSFDVVGAIGLEERQRGKPLDQLATRLRSRKALEQLLEDQPGREHLVRAFKSAPEHFDSLGGCPSVAAESQRPDGRVHEQTHDLRARSAL